MASHQYRSRIICVMLFLLCFSSFFPPLISFLFSFPISCRILTTSYAHFHAVFVSYNLVWIYMCIYIHAKLLLSCPTLCDPMDCSPPGSADHGFSRQEYWSGLPRPLPAVLPDSEVEPTWLTSPTWADRRLTAGKTWQDLYTYSINIYEVDHGFLQKWNMVYMIFSILLSLLGNTSWDHFKPAHVVLNHTACSPMT